MRGWTGLWSLLLVCLLTASAAGADRPVVVIDAGHGGRDHGTHRGRSLEKDINLSVAKRVAAHLEDKGIEVILTRKSDRFVELEERANLANRNKADLFVSLHCDWNPDSSMDGFSVLLPQPSSDKTAVAGRAIAAQLQRVGVERRAVRRDTRGLHVLDETNCPAVLVEMGFMSNRADAARLSQADHRKKLAGAIAAGITRYLQKD